MYGTFNLNGSEVDTVILGQVLQTGCGQNPARQAAINSGIDKDKTATTINQVCGSKYNRRFINAVY